MDGIPGKPARVRRAGIAAALALVAAGCGKSSWWPIRPFGSVQTYSQTVVPGPAGHPRGKMVTPMAPGIDLVRRPGQVDTATRPASN